MEYFPKSRTTIGYKLWTELSDAIGAEATLQEIERRVEVRVDRVSEDMVRVWTRLDGMGDWVDDGQYSEAR